MTDSFFIVNYEGFYPIALFFSTEIGLLKLSKHHNVAKKQQD